MPNSETLRSTDDDATYCIACGEVLHRSEACAYDKHGDWFDRQDKQLEAVCEPCHREYSQLPRGELESVLIEADAGRTDNATFLSRYFELIQKT